MESLHFRRVTQFTPPPPPQLLSADTHTELDIDNFELDCLWLPAFVQE